MARFSVAGFNKNYFAKGAGIIILLFLTGFTSVCVCSQTKILSLNSYHNGYKWTDPIVYAERDIFTRATRDLEFYVEYMDTKRVSGDEYFSHLKQIYKIKYSRLKLDLIIASDDDAFRFLLKYKDEVFPSVPVVFCGVNDFNPSMIAKRDDFTGYMEYLDAESTISLMLKLHPQTKRIFVISDCTVTGFAHRKSVQDISAKYPKINFIYLNGEDLTTAMLIQRVQQLKNGSLAIFTVWNTDKKDVFVSESDVISLLSANSPVPIYCLSDSWLGLGIVGGKLNSAAMHGKIAAQIGIEILNGKKPSEIPVEQRSPNQFMFDYNALKKWNIDFSLLPAQSVIINIPSSFYHKYKRLIWIVVSLILVQAIIIVELCLNIIRRKKAELSLVETERKFRMILENSSDILIFLDLKKMKYEYISPALHKITGYTPEEITAIGPLNIKEIIHPHDIESYMNRREKILGLKTGEEPNLYLEYRMKTKSGEYVWLSDEPKLVWDKKGAPEILVGSVRDITYKKIAEEKLKKQTEKLIESNAELERYTFIASHDMQEPLRIITTYLNIIYEKYASVLDPEAKNYIDRSIDNSVRMRRLIKDFLALTQLSKTPPKIDCIDCNKTLNKVLSELEPAIKESGADILIEPLPHIYADENLFITLMHNLLENAIKFRDYNRPLKIKLSVHKSNGNWIFSLRDNGIGIDSKFKERIFLLFERLSTRKNFFSTGIGLAIAKKIVENHNGRIWVESEQGHGSIFHFSIPIIKE